MGLTVHVYRHDLGDCSNNGVSARFDRLTITNIEGPSTPSQDAPAARLVQRPRVGNVVIEPEETQGQWHSFGGCFAHTSDSRFSEAVRNMSGYEFGFAVPIHDRVE